MKGLIGIALALTVALIGCQKQSAPQGGGGGVEKKTTTTTTTTTAKTAPTFIEQAAKKSGDASVLLSRKDFKGAERDVQQTRDLIGKAHAKAPADLQGKLSELDKSAAKAQASIASHSPAAVGEVSALTKGLKDMVATESQVMGGGGKPMTK
ncbi:MAG TPA: hypothetical protein V6D00_12490 [Pantanalinema sp.]